MNECFSKLQFDDLIQIHTQKKFNHNFIILLNKKKLDIIFFFIFLVVLFVVHHFVLTEWHSFEFSDCLSDLQHHLFHFVSGYVLMVVIELNAQTFHFRYKNVGHKKSIDYKIIRITETNTPTTSM